MKRFVIGSEETSLDSLREVLSLFLHTNSPATPDVDLSWSYDLDEEDEDVGELRNKYFERALKHNEDLQLWWEGKNRLPQGTMSVGTYPIRNGQKTLGKVELLIETNKKGNQARWLLSSDVTKVNLEELAPSAFSWMQCEPTNDDLWFHGTERKQCRIKRGLIDVARSGEGKLFVALEDKIVSVCDLSKIKQSVSSQAISLILSVWRSSHQLRPLAQTIFETYQSYIESNASVDKLTAACKRYLKAHNRTIGSIRGKQAKMFPDLFMMIAESLQSTQVVVPLYHFLMRDTYTEMTGGGDSSDNEDDDEDSDWDFDVLWSECIVPFDVALLDVAHQQVLAALPKGAKHEELRTKVTEKIAWEKRKTKKMSDKAKSL